MSQKLKILKSKKAENFNSSKSKDFALFGTITPSHVPEGLTLGACPRNSIHKNNPFSRPRNILIKKTICRVDDSFLFFGKDFFPTTFVKDKWSERKQLISRRFWWLQKFPVAPLTSLSGCCKFVLWQWLCPLCIHCISCHEEIHRQVILFNFADTQCVAHLNSGFFVDL